MLSKFSGPPRDGCRIGADRADHAHGKHSVAQAWSALRWSSGIPIP